MTRSRTQTLVRGSEVTLMLACVAALTLIFLLYSFPAHSADPLDDPAWNRWVDARSHGDVTDVRCYRKKYLREHVGKRPTRKLFRENPDARSLCGTLRCRSEFHCHFDALVFVDENPPAVRPVPPVQAKTRSPLKRLFRRNAR